jgi:hypothetical protein
MLKTAIAVNLFQLNQFASTVRDLNPSTLYSRSPGHNHPAVWVLGHLAITGELGQRILGGRIEHPKWVRMFGIGSSDDPATLLNGSDQFTLPELVNSVESAYAGLRQLAANASDAAVDAPHNVPIFQGTPIETSGLLICVLLTNHFGFHLSQLSACRRDAGHPPLF